LELLIWCGSSGNYDASCSDAFVAHMQSIHSSIRTTRTAIPHLPGR
jgi:hypothetical protein